MIIHEPQKKLNGDSVRLSARFEVEKKPALSGELWFELPVRYADKLTSQVNPFATMLVLFAMRLNERLVVHGELSPLLCEGLKKYQTIFNSWFPDFFHPVEVTAQRLTAERLPNDASASASTFSGGVDSFYTMLSLLSEQSKTDHALKYLILIHGFDIPLRDLATFNAAKEFYDRLARKLGLELIPVTTNFRDLPIAGAVNWELTHGSVLGAVGQLLSPGVTQFYIPSSHTEDDHLAWGSHPDTDPLLSTESLTIIHDSPGVNRVEKTRVVARSPLSRDALRVCWENLDGINNCCLCSKCIRTMLTLDIIGELDEFATFPLPMPRNVRRWAMTNTSALLFGREVLALAEELGHDRWIPDVKYTVRRSAGTIAVADFIAKIFRLEGSWPAEFIRHTLFRLQGLMPWPNLEIRKRLRALWS